MKKLILALCLLIQIPTLMASDELTLYVVPSPLGMDWSSPAKIAWTALKNRISFKPRFMGHVFVELKCGEEHELTGMTGKNFDYLNQLLIEGRGFGILYHGFQGGLEDKEVIEPELKEYLKTGYANFTRFLLNSPQCQRLMTYLKEYREHNVGRYYGLAHRPRFGEGAGCSAFGVSFSQVVNVLDQEMKEAWSQTVLIPLEYSGPPLTDQSVSLFKIFLNAHRWARPDEKHAALTFWDPDRMHAWVKKKVEMKQENYPILTIDGAQGVVVDKSYLLSPESPIWLQHTDPTYLKK